MKKSIQLDNAALAKEQRQEVGLMNSLQLLPPGGDEVITASDFGAKAASRALPVYAISKDVPLHSSAQIYDNQFSSRKF